MNAAAITLAMLLHLVPPADYDYEPVNYSLLQVSSLQVVQTYCGPDTVACALLKARVIVYPQGLKPKVEAAVLRHEKAHLNGWRHP